MPLAAVARDTVRAGAPLTPTRSEAGAARASANREPNRNTALQGVARRSADAYDEARTVNWIDPYSVLGLDKNDTLSRAKLQVALRKELLRWHPDHNASDSQFASERTKRILAAYHTLRQSAT